MSGAERRSGWRGQKARVRAPPEPPLQHAVSRDRAFTEAVHGLYRSRPDLSAFGPGPRWLPWIGLPCVSALSAGLVLQPLATLATLGALLLLPFLLAAALRVLAVFEILVAPRPRIAPPPSTPAADAALPRYTVLVPLYDEAGVLPSLVAALSRLDYPSDRLEIILVLEARDLATRRAAASTRLPPGMRWIVVPEGGPRTKPKALNYALAFSSGDLVVVYDAEDRPEPGQLRLAAAAFRRASPGLACVQARLNVYNPADSFLTRQFTLEYSSLFDGLLPALQRLSLPIPLGGTSNHFRTDILRAVGAWDPYNVTEDADLGIRLARSGYRTETLASTTWEEAPVSRRIWIGQRTRWIKGWMQTWLVHMRRPGRLLRELGLWRFLGVQVVMGGVLLSALAYPLALAGLALATLYGTGGAPDTPWAIAARHVAVAAFVIGMSAPVLSAAAAVARRRWVWLVPWAFLMPVYWLLVSWAGYRALVELFHRPFHWEKTRHGLSLARRFARRS